MITDPQDRPKLGLTPPDETSTHDEIIDCPEVITHGEGRVLFGPGLDDFNAFDDPC